MTAAVALAGKGLRVLVLEAEAQDRVRAGSRAIAFFGPTLRRWEKIRPGMGKAIADAGTLLVGMDTFYGDKRIFELRLTPAWSSRLVRTLSQKKVEQILYAEAIDLGVEFRWTVPVTDVKTHSDGAMIELESGEQISTAYVIAADGAKSARTQGARHQDGRSDRSHPVHHCRRRRAPRWIYADQTDVLPIQPARTRRTQCHVHAIHRWDAYRPAMQAGRRRRVLVQPRRSAGMASPGGRPLVRRAHPVGLDVPLPPGCCRYLHRPAPPCHPRGRGGALVRPMGWARPELRSVRRHRRRHCHRERADRSQS
ncbi:hypothetical protein F3087_40755 [Nocardia colli]|uniref:FAD-binding domain-containing protein n=1 Tax=Nocardia colli TaxID=2545717 RepID=A0A5N0DWD6_9NOCA|nr:hypothetical protein F3087_40755 [Nocardia colli]